MSIGSILAQSGANMGSVLGSGMSGLGSAAEGMLTTVGQGINRRGMEKEATQLLAANKDNPAALMEAARKFAMQGNREYATMFEKAAQAATQSQIQGAVAETLKPGVTPEQMMQTAQQLNSLGRTQEAMALVGKARELKAAEEEKGTKRGLQGALVAITQAASRDIALEDLKDAQGSVISLGGTQEDIMKAYKEGVNLAKPSEKQYNFTEETIIKDGKPIRVQVATNKANPNDQIVTDLGEASVSGTSAEDKKTIAQLLKDQGVENVDLTTVEGAKQARRDIITYLGNASLANSVTNIIEDLTPLSVREGLEIVRSTNPEFVEAENLREQTSRFATLAELSDEDIAGLSALIERTLTATTENDIKAVAELERFRKAKDLPQRIKDYASELATGRLSRETIEEYTTLATALEELAEMRMSRALDAMIINGSPKESDAAQRAKNQILGVSQARIIN